MARSHARIFTVIWDDPDFLALSGLAQRCYMMLLSQPNLGHAGLLSTTFRRWTLLCADEDEERLRAAITELTERRFIVVDERTEELLVRSLIRNDGVWKQPKVLAVAITEAASIRSPRLRAAVAEELARIDCAELPPTTRPAVEVLLKDLPQRLANARLEAGTQDPPHPPANPPPHPPADDAVDEGADVLRVRAGAATTPATVPIPSPVPPPAGAKTTRRRLPPAEAAERQRHVGEVVAAFVDGARDAGLHDPPAPLRSRVGKQARELLAEDWSIDFLIDSARRMGAGEFSDLATQVRKDDAAAKGVTSDRASPASRRQQETDDTFDRAMQRAREREERQRDTQ